MSEKSIETYIDLGSSKLRIGIFDKSSVVENFFAEKNCLSNFNLNNFSMKESNQIIKELIQKAEKKIGIHINDVNLLFDNSEFFTIDISIKKNLEGQEVDYKDIKYLLQESRQLVQKNYTNHKIIHIIVKKFFFDEKEFDYLPDKKKIVIFYL